MRLLILILLSFFVLSEFIRAEVLTTQDLVEQTEKWPDWAREEKSLQITGRYRGSLGTTIQLQKLKLNLVPERGLLIQDRIRSGDRLAIFGRFAVDGEDIEFRMSRCDVRKSDLDEFRLEISKLTESDAAGRYQIINRYAQLADFFGDRQLRLRVLRQREVTFARQRSDAQNDPQVLWTLVEPGPGFDIGQTLKQELLFQICWLRSEQQVDEELLDLIRSHLPGWKEQNMTLPQSMLQAFEKDPVASYGKGDELHRRQIERLLYRRVKLKEITAAFKTDGSNAQAISRAILKELPEETDAATRMDSAWADYRLSEVESMPRSQLEAFVALLQRLDRTDDVGLAIDRWLQQQIARFERSGLEGQVRIGEEHLYAWDRWKDDKYRDRGIEYFKEGWKIAARESAADAKEIEQRLENLGWTRLHDRWLTDTQVKQLPASDIELAAREGRVVRGMSPAQVRVIHGVPTRRIRMASSRHVEELWMFGERRTSRLAIHLRRARGTSEDVATVIDIFQQSGN